MKEDHIIWSNGRVQGNVQPLRNAQRWECGGVIHFVMKRYWRGRGFQVILLRNADKISQLVFI